MQQGPVIRSPFDDPMSADLAQLRTRAGELRGRADDLDVRRMELEAQRKSLGADVDPSVVNTRLAAVEHDLTATLVELGMVNKKIENLETQRDMARVGITHAPPPLPIEAQLARERMVGFGTLVLLLPLVLAYARRLWHRGGPRQSVDIEESPRLQRMEQAIESIALEVERIGEAQRFTTKLLTERHADAAARLSVPSRREPGTITPH